MPMKLKLRQIALASLLATATLMAQTPYDEGQKAIRDQRWSEAADQFELAIKSDREQADSATYWRAYALFQAGRDRDAERELRRLERKYPDSRWVREGQALRIEHQDSERSIEQATSSNSVMDDELRLFALAQLMEREPERATPLLMDMVHNAGTQKVRQDALFVLAMSEEPEALRMLADVARNNDNPKLQVAAIHILGSASTEESLPLLATLYTESSAFEVKEALIHAHIASDQPQSLITIFESEANPELRRSIIHSLGAMDATEELQALYPTLQDPELRVAVIEAYSIAGDSGVMKQVLDTETNPEIRRAALFGIAMEGGSDAASTLETLYDQASSTGEKSHILEALTMMDDARDLTLKIIRTEKDPELQRQAIQTLGVLDGSEELEALYSSLTDKDTRKTVLEALVIADDPEALIRVLQEEQDEQLRSAAINYLAVAGGETAKNYLASLYSSGSREEKSAVIQSMMIMDDTEGLIELLKQETDPELKRQMLQMLTLMDSEESNQYLFEMLEKDG
jgi:HEAT repeat protein